MCFYFKRELMLLPKFDDPGIVAEGGQYPGFVELARGCANGLVEKMLVLCRKTIIFQIRIFHLYLRFKGLMDAVFTPCLGDHLELHIAEIASFPLAISLDSLHFLQI